MKGYPIYDSNYNDYQKAIDWTLEGYAEIGILLEKAKKELNTVRGMTKKDVSNFILNIEEIIERYKTH